MNQSSTAMRHGARALALAGVVAFIGACASMSAPMYSQTVNLVGANEVPPVTTTATATGTVTISPDRMVVAKITVTGMTPPRRISTKARRARMARSSYRSR